MNMSVADFISRHPLPQSQRVAELVEAIRSGEVKLLSVSADVSAEQLASTYAIRSSIAKSQGRSEIAAEFGALAEHCKVHAGAPCCLWLFEGQRTSYAAFELRPSATIAACFKFNGPLSGAAA